MLPLGSKVGLLGGSLEPMLGHFGAMFGYLGPMLALCWANMKPSTKLIYVQGFLEGLLGPCWVNLLDFFKFTVQTWASNCSLCLRAWGSFL